MRSLTSRAELHIPTHPSAAMFRLCRRFNLLIRKEGMFRVACRTYPAIASFKSFGFDTTRLCSRTSLSAPKPYAMPRNKL